MFGGVILKVIFINGVRRMIGISDKERIINFRLELLKVVEEK